MKQDLPPRIRRLRDDAWLKLLVRSISERHIDGVDFPGFPSRELQKEFVGSADEETLKEAYAFYIQVKAAAKKLRRPLGPGSHFLDFGCGWGRYLRFFWKDVDEQNLFGCDVNQPIVDTCLELNVPGRIDRIDPLGRLPYPDEFFDGMMAYSVFTHLPEPVHLHWVRELARVARRGAVFCLTLEPRRFLHFIETIPQNTQVNWLQKLSTHKPAVPGLYSRFDAGQFVFLATNEGVEDTYGDALVPLPFVKRQWAPWFEVHSYIDDPYKFQQAVLVVRRK